MTRSQARLAFVLTESLDFGADICDRATEYMKHNEPLIIIRNTNIRVWEISPYLQLAATYGYTVVILDLNKNLAFDPQVMRAYGSKDEISVVGYAVLGDLVLAMVHLTDVQEALIGDSKLGGDRNAASNGANDEDWRPPMFPEFDEMRCTLNLDTISTQAVGHGTLEETSASHELPPPSRLSFIVLGSTSSEPVTYSEAVRRLATLRDAVISWRYTPASEAKANVGGVVVYGARSENGCPLLVLDEKTVKLDVLFTGYYQAHITRVEGFMKTDSAVIINQSPCVMVWETTSFIALACTYGYTVIIIDLPRETSSDSQVLITPDKAQEKPYVTYSVKRWEELHPFAMGWSARPKDAARLLRRFRQLRTVLLMRDLPHKPFLHLTHAVTRLTQVRKAYGRSDTLHVFGYAISQGFVFALLELSDQQASLTRGDGGASGDIDPQSWKEVSCLVDLARFSPEEDGNDREGRVGQRVSLEDVDASRVTFMPLGSVRGVRYSYSRASGVPWALLSSRLRSWTAQSAEGTGCSKRVAGVDVYGSIGAADDVLLLVDDKTVELDVVFTGCYHPHTTALSNRIPAMPRVACCSSPERCSWRQGRRGGRPEGTLSWRIATWLPEQTLSRAKLPASDGDGSKTRFTEDTDVLDVVDFPCLVDEDTVEFLRSHGRVLFISRGPPGCGKGPVSCRLHELYPGSHLYWADQMFIGPNARERTKEALQESHKVCREKTAEYMEQNAPFLIIRNANLNVWEISPYLQLAATYGYTMVILDNDKHLSFEAQVLAATNNKGLGVRYMNNRLRQWEDVYPFAMGWCPRPRDAASLLRRFKEIAAQLSTASTHLELKAVRNSRVFPFCPARVCWFGWDEQDKSYCCSEPVTKAYGSKDTISVFGYAVLGDMVTAMVHLTDDQAVLTGDSQRSTAARDSARHDGPPNSPFSRLEFDEMRCALDLDALDTTDVHQQALEEAAAYHELPQSSRMSFIILGSTSTESITYSEDVRRCSSRLRDAIASWRDTPASEAKTNVGGVVVYGARSENGCPLLILDEKTVKLDVLFTGYYQAHTTRDSPRCETWSTGGGSTKRGFPDTPQRVGARSDKQTVGGTWYAADSKHLLDGIEAPCVKDHATQLFLNSHGRLLFLVRGPPSPRKSAVVAELEKLYPVSRAYMPRERDGASVRELHQLCLDKTEDLMRG
ncbi:hypothetical protein V5799_009102 [Amblyomma americanum]|uniref:2',3'-cyclic-nucleotide 3'-phosphodiesterase n=1 Tax=Amblyomma americanum TaxID=6943 RepID=A0AAQ4FD59_AMBAM